MSDFKFSCPSCGLHIVCDTSNAGMQIPCPGCQTLLTIPQPPQPAPAAPTGKLTINKAAHQSHAPAPKPAGVGGPPPKPSWGAAPQPAPPPKKKLPLIPIITGCAVVAVLAIGWFAFLGPYLQQRAEKQKQAELEAQRQAAAQAKAAAEAAKPKPKAAWKLDLENVQFPDRPAAGKNHGADFGVQTAVFVKGALVLIQASSPAHQFVIAVPLKAGEGIAEKSIDVSPTNTGTQPLVMLSWMTSSNTPGTEMFAKGYAMKLQFGTVTDGKLPGKIYLCVPDREQSFVAGNFEIEPRNVPAGAPKAHRPPPPGAEPRRRKTQ